MCRTLARAAAAAAIAALALVPGSPAADVPPGDMLAAWPHPKGYVCYRAPGPITIDGDLKSAEWDAAPWSDAFVDIEGDKRPKPQFRTRMKMLWDDEALYIAAELEEPHVWATIKEHDAVIFQDPDFEIFLDPDGDNHTYAELELNALNTTWDLLLTKPYKNGGRALNGWEIIGLKTAVKVQGTLNDPRDTDTGWTIEVRWPWKGLRELATFTGAPRDGDQWRINFSRVEWDIQVNGGQYTKVKNRPEHNWVWAPQGVIDMHRPERWGYLQFSTAKPGTTTFKPDPDWPVRDALHRAYYAQRAHHKKNGTFATAADLGLKDIADRLDVRATRTGCEISWLEREAKPPKVRYSITDDARLWKH
ncbi:carbohydrate-binding family 9-like protein [Gemmata sp. JC717]|uniref:carbohydrate-binding family 9-like protein n=1 Tax=Gemmata algarum TaxID=2975278 RepID=UPI0021BA5173|nr:carbohydrate-binding family 9-like protein [Gemmata algarum]MDY3553713.1 carbohydrate-binding family 9-like protein [Gemmata algarum]